MKKFKKVILVLCFVLFLFSTIYCVYAAENNINPPCEHIYKSINYTGNNVVFRCNNCSDVIIKSKEELIIEWDVKYVNKAPNTSDYSLFLDVVSDNIINAKDYAAIKKTAKQ